MTELLDEGAGGGLSATKELMARGSPPSNLRVSAESERMRVRVATDGSPSAVRIEGGWRAVTRTVNRWVVETDWWRAPVRREYRRCLVAGGDCLELCRELDTVRWTVVRRYD